MKALITLIFTTLISTQSFAQLDNQAAVQKRLDKIHAIELKLAEANDTLDSLNKELEAALEKDKTRASASKIRNYSIACTALGGALAIASPILHLASYGAVPGEKLLKVAATMFTGCGGSALVNHVRVKMNTVDIKSLSAQIAQAKSVIQKRTEDIKEEKEVLCDFSRGHDFCRE